MLLLLLYCCIYCAIYSTARCLLAICHIPVSRRRGFKGISTSRNGYSADRAINFAVAKRSSVSWTSLVAAKYSWQFDVDAIRYGDFDVCSKADYSSQLNLSGTRNKKTNNNEKKLEKGYTQKNRRLV